VVTHAVLAARQGLRVVVSIDDLAGQALAIGHRLDCFTVEDALSAAVEHGVLDIPGVRDVYQRLRKYGDSLPTWEASELPARLKNEARQRRTYQRSLKRGEPQGQ